MLKFQLEVMYKFLIPLIVLALFIPSGAFAHKLIPTDGSNIDYETALEIPDPVISWAMYETLEDRPLYYKFEAEKGDRLFSSIVIPKLEPLEDFTPSLALIGPETFLELVDELRVIDSSRDFGYSSDVVDGVEHVTIRPIPGNLVLLNPNYYHKIGSICGTKPRISIGFFFAESSENNLYCWS